MDRQNRRAMKRDWRERETAWAVVALRIGARTWVKLTPDARALENRLGFMLRQGGGAGLAPGMATAWREAGELRVEVVDELDADLSELARERIGAERLAHWSVALGAETA